MKLYSKSNLTYSDGYLVTKEGDVVAIDNEIVDLANELERRLQYACWLRTQPSVDINTDGSEFERISERAPITVTVKTPMLDKKIKKSMKIMREIDLLNYTDKINDDIAGMMPLVEFVKEDNVLSVEHATLHRFDLPVLGNPLHLTVKDILDAEGAIYDKDIVFKKNEQE